MFGRSQRRSRAVDLRLCVTLPPTLTEKNINQITHTHADTSAPLKHTPRVSLIQTHRHNPGLSGPLIYKTRERRKPNKGPGHKRSATFPVISQAQRADSSGEEEQEEEQEEEEGREKGLKDMKDNEEEKRGKRCEREYTGEKMKESEGCKVRVSTI